MSLSPRATAMVDQVHADTAATLDQLVDMVRMMAASGVDPAEQIALVTLALFDVLEPHPANLAGLAATAILRLAGRPQDGGTG